MHKQTLQIFILNLVLIMIFVAGYGCGNIFDSLVTRGASYLSESAQTSFENGDYEAAIEDAQEVIDNPDATDEQVGDAYTVIGRSELAEVLDPAEIAENIAGIDTTTVTNPMDIINEIFPTENVEQLQNAADALNTAADLGELTEEEQLDRAVANAAAGAANLVNYIDSDGSPVSDSMTVTGAVAALIADGTIDYLLNAAEAAEAINPQSSALSTSVGYISDAGDAAREMSALDWIFNNNYGTSFLDNAAYIASVSTLNGDLDDSDTVGDISEETDAITVANYSSLLSYIFTHMTD